MANYNLIESTKNAELVTGTSNSDSIIIGGNNVTVNASGGGDIIRLNGGKETTSVNGGKYDSSIWEDTDITNFVYGEGGNDSIYFNQSHANANGGAGNDYFHVNEGAISGYADYHPRKFNDIIITGGTGKDTVEINLIEELEVVVTDFSNDDALFINEFITWDKTYSDGNSSRRVITQRVENGNVIISDNSSITSSGNDTVSKTIPSHFNITLQGVSDISQVADAEYFVYDNHYQKFTQHSTLGELFGVESSGSKTSTNIDEKPEDKDSTTTTTKPTTTTTEPTTNKTTSTTSTSTPTVTSGSGSGDTIINNNYYGDYYDMSKNNGTIVNQSSVEGGVTNNTSVDNSTTIIRYGNIYTYNGGNKTITIMLKGKSSNLKAIIKELT